MTRTSAQRNVGKKGFRCEKWVRHSSQVIMCRGHVPSILHLLWLLHPLCSSLPLLLPSCCHSDSSGTYSKQLTDKKNPTFYLDVNCSKWASDGLHSRSVWPHTFISQTDFSTHVCFNPFYNYVCGTCKVISSHSKISCPDVTKELILLQWRGKRHFCCSIFGYFSVFCLHSANNNNNNFNLHQTSWGWWQHRNEIRKLLKLVSLCLKT